MIRCATILACVMALFTLEAHGATVERLTLKELTARSQVIFEASVSAQTVQRSKAPFRLVTVTTFKVLRAIKGQAASQMTIEQLGGSHGLGADRLTQSVPGYAQFRTGDRVLVFLEPTNAGRLVVTGLAQGAFVLTEDPEHPGQVLAKRSFEGLHFAKGPPQNTRILEGMPDEGTEIPLSQILEVIAGRHPTREPIRLRLLRPATRAFNPAGAPETRRTR